MFMLPLSAAHGSGCEHAAGSGEEPAGVCRSAGGE